MIWKGLKPQKREAKKVVVIEEPVDEEEQLNVPDDDKTNPYINSSVIEDSAEEATVSPEPKTSSTVAAVQNESKSLAHSAVPLINETVNHGIDHRLEKEEKEGTGGGHGAAAEEQAAASPGPTLGPSPGPAPGPTPGGTPLPPSQGAPSPGSPSPLPEVLEAFVEGPVYNPAEALVAERKDDKIAYSNWLQYYEETQKIFCKLDETLVRMV